MTTLYLIRHGTTNSNLAGVFQGSMDVPLNERGLSQAALLARRFEKVHLDKIYVSALQRARQTGEALAKSRGLEVQVMPLLNEIDLGEMEGHTGQECRQLFPQAVQDLEENTAWFQAPGGESTRQVYDRITSAIKQIVADNPQGTVAVVSHGFTIQVYLAALSGLPYEEIKMRSFIVGNTAVSKFVFAPGQRPETEYVNDQSHLPEELRFDLAENQPKG